MEQSGRQRYDDYKAFMRRHHEAVWRVCYDFARSLKHREGLNPIQRCEDMVQEVWIMVWLKFDKMNSTSEWQQRAWVRKVTHNVLIDLYRREHPPMEPLTVDMEESIAAEDHDVAERIDDLMAVLTPEEQQLMRMRLDGYSADEIADKLMIETNAVYQRVNRIMNKLRRRHGTGL